ncbi:hypothetical protein R1sor_017646 [Riccia sorocarpa]|uniref:protein-serine/threonine phosphatase n=1 Tax=Riccia sorocarpa TaxID=122646 RepID=A0ABD3I999_9MARC
MNPLFLVPKHSIKKSAREARFHVNVGAFTIFLWCGLLLGIASCVRPSEQEQPEVDRISLSPEGLCSVAQLSSRISQGVNAETRTSAPADQQQTQFRDYVNSAFQSREASGGSEEGLSSGLESEQLSLCGVALLQGRRPTQEDRAFCLPSLLLRISETVNITVGLYAVFDGHGGQEASTFAAEVFSNHFADHFTRILDDSRIELESRVQSTSQDEESPGTLFQASVSRQETSSEASILLDYKERSTWLLSETAEESRDYGDGRRIDTFEIGSFKEQPKQGYIPAFVAKQDGDGEVFSEKVEQYAQKVLEDGVRIRRILEEALSRSIHTINVLFATEATQLGLFSGTTACIVIQVERDLLIANLGDSKAFICEPAGKTTCKRQPRSKQRKKRRVSGRECKEILKARELTSDHSPDRDDERQRIEDAGGFVTEDGDVSRVNGKLAVSRSIGDVHLKRYGVSAEPEFTGWLKIPEGKSFLTIASDGVFEQLSTQRVCEVLQAVSDKEDVLAALGLEHSRVSAPIAMLASEVDNNNEDQFRIRDDCSESIKDGTCGSVEEKGRFVDSVLEVAEKEEKYSEADGVEELPLVEPESLVQLMAQAVVETAVELGSMDNVATIVLSLRPLPPLLPYPKAFFEKATDYLPRSTAHQQTGEKQPRHITVENLPYHATVVKTSPKADDVGTGGSTSRPWTKVATGNSSSRVMMHSWGNSYCYELIETLPRHAIVPLTSIMESGTLHKEDEVSEAFWSTDSPYSGESQVGGSLEVYREQLVCPPKHTRAEEAKQLCRRPEGLSRFLALIGSVPLDSQSLLSDTGLFGDPSNRPLFLPSGTRYHRYMLKKNFARGAFGEVWLAVRRTRWIPDGSDLDEVFNSSCSGEKGTQNKSFRHDQTTYVLKRILAQRGNHVYLSGLREKYFGEIFLNASRDKARAAKHAASLSCAPSNPFSASSFGFCPWRRLNSSQSYKRPNSEARGPSGDDFRRSTSDEGLEHIARYVESFEVVGPKELWLVFRNEGKSLSSLLYSSERAEVEPDLDGADRFFTVVQSSPWWHWLKTTSAGRKEMRSLLRQLLLAVKACHSRNITHRDIKPENMIVSWKVSQSRESTRKPEHPAKLKMRLIDFGSALDPFTVEHMYGPAGPSGLEQTNEYAPPEVLLGKHWLYFHSHRAQAYDMWSVGVVMLELVLGTPHVFQISSRTRALLDSRLQGWDQSARETAYMLRAFLEMCILLPGLPLQHQFHHRGNLDHWEEQRLASWECTEQAFLEQIKQRDVLGLGMPDKWALRLVRSLLQWYPEDRISAEDALKHPYFHPRLQVD